MTPGPSAPLSVVDIDLAEPGVFRRPGGAARNGPSGRALGLVRLHGRPLGTAEASGGGPDELWRALAAAARREFPAAGEEAGPDFGPGPALVPGSALETDPGPGPCRGPGAEAGPGSGEAPGPGSVPGSGEMPVVSVIVATRDRAGMLRDCLDSLRALRYPCFEVIVVDNAPADAATEELVRREYGGGRPEVRYLREPVPGLARAHNRGLAGARGRIAAFTDDDTLVDPEWLTALAAPFAADPATGCVTGLIVPAELETEAQLALERHGAFAKGYAPRTWSLRDPPPDPLFPFTAGRFGSGANMAFRTDLLRELGGFDPATGVGTPAHGGDDLLAFFRVIARGRALSYAPDAIVWHRHRRTADALAAQAFGYGAGLGAYLTSALVHEPRMLPAFLRRLPGGARYALTRGRARTGPAAGPSTGPGAGRGAVPPGLARRELRGLLFGPVGYARSRYDEHRLRHRTGAR
ncbi:glycosyltransferase [Streptomyces sp. NPDC088090]|uniref:glycosyltransferase n=1 Tax=Streptomyces sp. NPDC088090 TaxID=3365822 RepID=UPI00384DCAF5